MPLAAVLIAASCSGDDLGGEEVARVVAGDMAEVSAGDVWVSVGVGEGIPEGARLRTGAGEARIAFSSGEVWLAPQAAAVVGDDWFRLERGEALADSQGGLQTRWTDVEVTGEGVYRLALGIAPRIGVYSGQVRVRRVAEVRTLPALREASLTSRRLPASGQPLTYRIDDPWDQILLREAVAFDLEAQRLVGGLTRVYGAESRPEEFYAAFTATPERPLTALSDGGGGQRSPGETLLGLFVAQSATGAAAPEALDTALRDIVDLRAAGARWGLVAIEMGVTAARLAEVVDLAQARYTARLDQQAPAGAPSPAPADTPPAPEPSGSVGQEPAPPPPPPPPADPPQPQPPSAGAQPPPPPPPDLASGPGPGDDAGGTPQPQPNPTGLLGQRPAKGLVEAVVGLLLGGS